MTNTQTPRNERPYDPTMDTFRLCDADMRQMIVDQIGRPNLFCISGGRVVGTKYGIQLPVSNGYSVTVELDADDTYVVRRLFKRGTKVWIKGERTNVYCDEVSEVAYMAHAFRSYDADEWPGKA